MVRLRTARGGRFSRHARSFQQPSTLHHQPLPMFPFERLDTWQVAVELADVIYRETKGFPPDERFGLTNQMRRAAVSVSANRAEGSSRFSRTDFARFVEIATGSLFEVVSQSCVAKRQGFLAEEQFKMIYERAEQLGRMLSGLHASLAAER